MSFAADRTLRADAQRNLDLIVEAACEVFAEQGVDACVSEVAARAGVGSATVFRRFPTKEALWAAVVEQRVREHVERARRAAVSKHPARALREFMQASVASFIRDRGFCEAAATGVFGEPHVRELLDEASAYGAEILRRAQEAGEVRGDVTPEDVSVLLMAIVQAGSTLEHAAPGAWRRQLDIVLDGLRPEAARPLSRRPLTLRQLDAARCSASWRAPDD
jgi:AcrR family transcriptional regulator